MVMVWIIEANSSLSIFKTLDLNFLGRQVSFTENMIFIVGNYNPSSSSIPTFVVDLS